MKTTTSTGIQVQLGKKMTHKEKIKKLKFTKGYIKALAHQQDVEFKKLLAQLGYTESSEPEATLIFDFLYNGTFSATQTLKRIKCPTS